LPAAVYLDLHSQKCEHNERSMAKTSVVFYQEDPNNVPVLKWLDRLPLKVQDKCRVRIERLRDLGHELRRPEADYLRDGIYELRIGFTGMNYRILYFFYGQIAAVLSHGLVKEREVPARDIEEAVRRRRRFETNPKRHTYKGA
jgi:phage-related protein